MSVFSRLKSVLTSRRGGALRRAIFKYATTVKIRCNYWEEIWISMPPFWIFDFGRKVVVGGCWGSAMFERDDIIL